MFNLDLFRKLVHKDKLSNWSHPEYPLAKLKAQGFKFTPNETYPDEITCRYCHHQAFDWAGRSDYPQHSSVLPWLHDESCGKHASKLSAGSYISQAYTSLRGDGSQIRLLELHPRESSPFVRCTLEVVDRSANPQYQALSYRWGNRDGIKPFFILLNGLLWRVTPNLYHALKALQHERDIRCLWVDALAINQFDDEEKTHQVKLMAQIYSHSAETQIWLNESSDSLPLASHAGDVIFRGGELDASIISNFVHQHVDFSHVIGPPSEALSRIGQSCGCCRDQPVYNSLVDQHYLGALCLLSQLAADAHLHHLPYLRATEQEFIHCSMWTAILLAVNAIVLRPWFQRLWIIQEAVLSPTSVVHFRRFRFPFQILLKAQSNAYKHNKDCCSAVYAKMPFMQQNVFRKLTEKLSYFKADVSANSWSLTRTVWRFMSQDATDSRDKVFGVLSLMSDEYKKWVGNLLPNYKLTLTQAYVLAASFMVTELWDGRSLRMLTLVRKKHTERLGLPSWVPDWSTSDPIWNPRLFFSLSYRASADVYIKPVPCFNFLTLGNCGVDVVRLVGDPITNLQDGRHIVTTIAKWAEIASLYGARGGIAYAPCVFCGKAVCQKQDASHRDEAFYRTLICDLIEFQRVPADATVPRATDENVQKVAELLKWGQDNPELFVLEHVPNHLRFTLIALIGHLNFRKFFVTRLGLFGLGPHEMIAGDEVRIVFGSDVPFILRPAQDFFRWRYTSYDEQDTGPDPPPTHQPTHPSTGLSTTLHQDYLPTCSRRRLSHRTAASRGSSQDYSSFVAAAFVDWYFPPSTDLNPEQTQFNLVQQKTMRMMALSAEYAEVADIYEKATVEVCKQVRGIKTSELMETTHAKYQSSQAALKGEKEDPSMFDGRIVGLNQTHLMIGDCYVHGIMDGQQMIGFDGNMLSGSLIQTNNTPYDRIILA